MVMRTEAPTPRPGAGGGRRSQMSVDVPVLPGRVAVAAWGKALSDQAFAFLPGPQLAALLPGEGADSLARSWDDLDRDDTLFDGGTYRFRRYGRLNAHAEADGRWSFSPLPHAAFRQSAEHLPDYGGRERMFSPIPAETLTHPVLLALVSTDLSIVAAAGSGAADWEVGLHMIRVMAAPGSPGRPTPEGRHCDGHDYIGMHLMRRENCIGGESTVYRADGGLLRLTLDQSLDSLVVADRLITHGVSPITADGGVGVRDMLLVDLNAV
jgi:hypothetical protein